MTLKCTVELASKSNVDASTSIATSAALPISIPPAPSNANTVPAPISIPPAVAVTAIASVAVPAVLVVDHFSLPAVPCGVHIVSTAPFKPTLTVCPSTTLISIDPADESRLIAPVVSTSRSPAFISTFPPVVVISISLPPPPAIVTAEPLRAKVPADLK
jgi:hypothetical protein